MNECYWKMSAAEGIFQPYTQKIRKQNDLSRILCNSTYFRISMKFLFLQEKREVGICSIFLCGYIT